MVSRESADHLELILVQAVVVTALVEVHDGVELRHRGRLFGRPGDDADIGVPRVPQQVRAAIGE